MEQKIWEAFTNQKQWEIYIKALLKTDTKALYKAIVLIYDLQTEEEKIIGKSIEDNNAGFGKIDAYELGEIAKKIKMKIPLTRSEIDMSRNKMQKYWKQLMLISKRKMRSQKLKVDQPSEQNCPCQYGICSECQGIQLSMNCG